MQKEYGDDMETKIKLMIPISIDKPNVNGVIYTEDAVIKAICNSNENLPILYRSENEEKVIGSTIGGCSMIHWDFENQVCNVIVDGVLFSSGVDVMINKVEDGKVTDFRIMNIGIGGDL